jgi:hypothetical protein
VPVIKRLAATDPDALPEISGWLHDAYFDTANLTFDERDGTVTILLEQEPLEHHQQLPSPEHIRKTALYDEFAMPYLRCILRIAGASSLRLPEDAELLSMLLGLRYDPAGRVRVQVDTAEWIDIAVDHLDVELEITDTIEQIRRRRVGRGLRWDSTSNRPLGI